MASNIRVLQPSKRLNIRVNLISLVFFALYISDADTLIGPCAVYMKKVDDSTKDPGSGGGWFKIYEDGYKNGQWCNDRINQAGGVLTVTIPRDLKKGHYLIRGEHIGLHSAAEGQSGAQFYMTYVSNFLPPIFSLLMAVGVVNFLLLLWGAKPNHKQCPFQVQTISNLVTNLL